ncbi:MAG: hypothetical protein AAF429_14540 [Pseudomonadota bacterium]
MKLYATQKGIKGYGMAILDVLIDHRHYDDGQSRPGRELMMRYTNADRKTVDRWLHKLREEGVIEAIAYPNGGFRCATVYAFPVPAWTRASQIVDGVILPKTTSPKMSNNLPQNVQTTSPKTGDPTGLNNFNRGEEKEPASRGQERKAPDSQQAADALRLAELMKHHGYSEARSIMEEEKNSGDGG